MMMIKEEPFSPSTVTSNVPITETEWSEGSYTRGTRRYVGTDLYEVAAETTTDAPVEGAALPVPSWVLVGKINKWRMFSDSIAEQSVLNGPIEIEFSVPADRMINAVAVFGAEAQYVEVIAYVGDDEVARRRRWLTNASEVSNWYEYFFAEIFSVEEAVVLDLPTFGTTRLVVRVVTDSPGAEVRLGKLVVGRLFDLGETQLDYGVGFEDLSTKERDEVFGDFKIVERGFFRRALFPVVVPKARINPVLRELRNVRARATVFIGDPKLPETIVFGFFKEAWILRSSWNDAEMTLEIEGTV